MSNTEPNYTLIACKNAAGAIMDGSSKGTIKYIGDGAYACFNGYHMWVYTADGPTAEDINNGVALDPDVLRRFLEFVEEQTP